MNDHHEAIIAGEIPALEQEISNSALRTEAFLKTIRVFGRTAFKDKEGRYLTALRFCLEYCREKIHAPRMFEDLLPEVEHHLAIEPDLFSKMSGITDHWKKVEVRRRWRDRYVRADANAEFANLVDPSAGHQLGAIRNIIFYRRTMGLQELFERLKVILAESPDIFHSDNMAFRRAWLAIAEQCAGEKRHRQPLNFLVARDAQIEGEMYEETAILLRKVCIEPNDGLARQDSDTIVDQAFKRIVEAISNEKEKNIRIEKLAERCRAYKLAFPEAQTQIDKLFRQEVENLKR